MSNILADCLSAYGHLNSGLPDEIIILKAGCCDGQKTDISQMEIQEARTLLKNMSKYVPNLTYIIVDKSSNTKFFANEREVRNPGHGTLINSKVVSKGYDFYLIAQHCNRGTVKPVHYQVLYSESEIEEGMIQELMYSQSFNYMNWSGSVRVPSVLQYAAKLAKFSGENLNQAIETKCLNDRLYYI